MSKTDSRQEGHVFNEEIFMELSALHRQGWSIAAPAREFNLNRRTVPIEFEAVHEVAHAA